MFGLLLATSVVDFLFVARGEGLVLELRRFLVSALIASLFEASTCFLMLAALSAAAAAAAAAEVVLLTEVDDLRLWADDNCFEGGAR